jgi:hypothetical protein
LAQYNADILLNVKYNERSLDRVAATVGRVQSLAKQIKPINLLRPGAGAGADQVAIAMGLILQRAKAINKEGATQISATYAGAAQTADAFAEVLRNVNITVKNGNAELSNQSAEVKELAGAYAEAAAKAETLKARYESLIASARQSRGLAIGPASALGTVEADSARATAAAQTRYQEQVNKNTRTDLLYQRLKLELLQKQSTELLKQDSLLARILKKSSTFSGGVGGFGENLALGVGFPLLFGGGPGSIAGSALGSFFGKGFGGQILGGALGQILDQALVKIRDIGNAISSLDFDSLTESGIRFSSEVQSQLDLLLQVGDALTAQKIVSQEVARETGTLPGVTEDVANSVNILNDSWRRTINAVSTTAGIIAAPLAVALAGILEAVNAIFRLTNTVFSLIGKGIKTVAEFVIQLVGGKDALDFINQGIDRLNAGLSEATAKAAEFRNNINQSVVRSSIELSAAQTLTPGVTSDERTKNILIDKQKQLNLLYQDEVDARVQIRAENAKASSEILDGLLRQNDILYKNKRELIEATAERQVASEVQREQARLEAEAARAAEKAARELERQRKEMERMAELRRRQLDDAQRSFVLAEADIDIATSNTKESKLQAEFDKVRIERMFTFSELLRKALSDEEREALVQTQYLQGLLDSINYEEQLLELKKQQTKEMYAQLGVSGILDEQVQKRLGRGMSPEDGADKRVGVLGFTSGIDLDPNNKATQKMDEMKRRLEELSDPINMAAQGAQGIGNAFSTAFQGIITGTQSTQEALSNFFKGVGDAFISMATEIIAQMVVMFAFKQLLGLFGGGGGGLFSGAGPVAMPGAGVGGGSSMFMPGAPSFFAEGGFVTGPTNALIGEGGESEYVIPASKMRTAMSRYAGGARGNNVIPGSGAEGGTEQGGVATMEPIDVRYSVERINSVDYVTADQFQAGMARAAQQGAVQGERRAMRSLKNSSATRRSVGI